MPGQMFGTKENIQMSGGETVERLKLYILTGGKPVRKDPDPMGKFNSPLTSIQQTVVRITKKRYSSTVVSLLR